MQLLLLVNGRLTCLNRMGELRTTTLQAFLPLQVSAALGMSALASAIIWWLPSSERVNGSSKPHCHILFPVVQPVGGGGSLSDQRQRAKLGAAISMGLMGKAAEAAAGLQRTDSWQLLADAAVWRLDLRLALRRGTAVWQRHADTHLRMPLTHPDRLPDVLCC